MDELNTTLHRLTLEQHLLAGIFMLGYGSALGSMFSPKGRLRAALLALLAAVVFAARTHPWEHGVLLVGCAIGGVAVFIALAWALSRIGAHRGLRLRPPAPVAGSAQTERQPDLPASALQTAQRAAQAARRRRRKTHTA
jgi:MFS family permease